MRGNNRMKKHVLGLCLMSSILMTACNDDDTSTTAQPMLSKTEQLKFADEHCWLGGSLTHQGKDRNNNQQLDANEITDSTTACTDTSVFSSTGVQLDYRVMQHLAGIQDDANPARHIEFRQGGFGSDLSAHPSKSNRFYGLTDRGPNADFKTTEAPTGKRFPAPSYVPRIGEFEITASGQVVKIAEILLKDRAGQTITGLPNPAGLGFTNEGAYDLYGKPLTLNPSLPFHAVNNPFKTDPYGLDPEGLVALADGGFWVSDEYGPHIIRYNAQGQEIDRINPFSQDDRRVSGYLLPAEFAKRRPNRGMEGLTITPDGKTLVGIMQSAMSLPNGAANKSNLTRIVTVDLETKKVTQYLYRQGNASENISGQEFSNSAILALSNTSFLVLERDGAFYRDNPNAVKRVYKIDLRTGSNLEAIAETAQIKQDPNLGLLINGLTLEQVIVAHDTASAFAAGWQQLAQAGIRPVEKSLVLDMVKEVKYPHDKMEGLWMINASTLAVMNDDDFSLWSNSNSFALQQKYLNQEKTRIDGNTLYVIPNVDLKPIP